MNATNKKPGLNLRTLSAVAQIAVKPVQPADAEIELARIYSVKQVRKTFRNLEELAESFKLNGIIEPLVVHEEEDGRYRIIVGERRYRAAPLAGLAKVPVIIKKGLNELQIRRLQVTENNDRDDLTAYEEAMGVIEDVEQYGTKEAMTIWNRGEAWVSKRMAVRRYADPVRELLENNQCGDFEVLHCLHQIYSADDAHTDFFRLSQRLRNGVPVSRDEVRDTLTRIKTWNKLQSEQAPRQIGPDKANKAGENPPEEPPAKQEGGNKNGRQDNRPSVDSKSSQQALPTTVLAPEQKAAAENLLSLQKAIIERHQTDQAQFVDLKSHVATLGYDMREAEWILWQGFLTVALPMLKGIGPERAVMYTKKLQGELKNKTPAQLWEELHSTVKEPRQNGIPKMPVDWDF